MLLRLTMRNAAVQATKKFVFSQVVGGYKTEEVKKSPRDAHPFRYSYPCDIY